MTHVLRAFFLLLLVIPRLAVAAPATSSSSAAEPVFKFGRFGNVTVYNPKAATRAAIFLSGDGGWNQGVVEMAKMLLRKDYLVIGVDVPRYMATAGHSKDKCLYPPWDLQALAQHVQRRLGMKRYLRPILIGYSSGATLAYAALAAAPAGTFDGAVSLGFCSDIETKKPLCKGEGLKSKPLPLNKKGRSPGYDLAPFKELPALWVALHGKLDQVCSLKQTTNFVAATGNARIIALDKVGHGFGVTRRWQTQYEQAVRDVSVAAFAHSAQMKSLRTQKPKAEPGTAPASLEDADLPLVTVETPEEAPKTDYFAVMISGDGGWAGLDRDVAGTLADAGVPVIGLDSLQYFWSKRQPQATADDLRTILTYYQRELHKSKIILIGYSFGADVLPFMASRLPEELKQQINVVAEISPSPKATFEFSVAEWFVDDDDDPEDLPVEPELAKLKTMQRLCFYGKEDKSALCPRLSDKSIKVFPLDGAHRLASASDGIVEQILKSVGLSMPPE